MPATDNLRIEHFDRRSVLFRLPMFQALAKHGHNPEDDFKGIGPMMAVFDGPALVAYAGYACYHGHWVLRNCVVAPSHRGRGLQRRLIAERLAYIQAKGGRKVSVWVSPSNTASIKNLVARGFKPRADKPRVFHGVAHVKMQLALS